VGNPISHQIYFTIEIQSCRIRGTPTTFSAIMFTRHYPCKENISSYCHPSLAISFYWDQPIQACLPYYISFQILVIVKNLIVHQCIVDDGVSSCIISFSSWKHLRYTTLIPSITKLRAFDGRLFPPLCILPNLPIELGSKTFLINVVAMTSLVDYNILLGCDYIYSMNFLVSSIFQVTLFPHVTHHFH
jgi:hypothetical protein